MKLVRLSLLLLVAGTVFAQTANVITLEPTDVAKVRVAWDNLQKAQAEFDSVKQYMGNRYTTVPESDSDASSDTTYVYRNDDPTVHPGKRHFRKGFSSGFEFSKDFKAIVPATTFTSSGTLGSSGSISGNCWTTPNTYCLGSACGCACKGTTTCGCR